MPSSGCSATPCPAGPCARWGLGKADHDGRKGGVTLAEARDKAAELRRLVKTGVDPLHHRAAAEAAAAQARAAAARAKTFAEAADLYLAAHEPAGATPSTAPSGR
jgi:hypothetical protein